MSLPPRSTRSLLVLLLLGLTAAGLGAWWLARRRGRDGPVAKRPAAPAVKPPAASTREPAVWAIVAGIDSYRDTRIPPCHGASGDARAVARWLAETAGWGRSHVLLLDDSGAADLTEYERHSASSLLPTHENLSKTAAEWLTSKPIRPGDVVVFYFAGQSALAVPPEAPAGTGATGVLLPIDARASAPAQSGWWLEPLIAAVSAAGAGPERPVRVVCWLDTSLGGRRDPWTPDGQPVAAGAGGAWLAGLARWPGVTAWLAADGGPSAEAPRSDQHSPFSAALLEGLGTPARPGNLLAGLDHMRRDPKLTAQGFRTAGGVAPEFGLWPSWVRRVVDAPPGLLLQRGHAGPVRAMAVTPDGARVITAGADSTVRLWRLSDRKLTGVLATHLIGVTSLSLRSDARLLASGDGDGRVRVWDLVRNVEVDTLPTHQVGIEALGFLPGGDRLVSLDLDGKAYLWEARENELGFFQIGRPDPLGEGASGLAVADAPGPVAFALAGPGTPIRLFDGTGASFATLEGPEGIVTSERFATDGRRVVAGGDSGSVVLFEPRAGPDARRLVLPDLGGPVDRIALGAGGRIALATAGSLRVGATGAEGSNPELASIALTEPVVRLHFSPDGLRLLALGRGGAPRAWELEAGPAARELSLQVPKPSPGYASAAFLPDGRGIVAGDRAGGLAAWDLPAGRSLFAPINGRKGRVAGISVSDDRRHLLEVTREGDALVWDLARGRSLARIDGRWVGGAIASDGRRLALTSREGPVRLIDRETTRILPVRFEQPEGAGDGCRFGPVAIRPGGRLVAAGSVQHGPLGPLVCVWEVETGKLVHVIKGHLVPHPITAVDFAPDGTRLLSASEDGTARVWPLDPGHPGPLEKASASFRVAENADDPPVAVTSARFDPSDPRLVATGSVDGRVLIWAAGSERPITTAGQLDRPVAAVAIVPGGRWLAAGGGDKEIRLWELSREPAAADGLAVTARRGRLQGGPHHDEQVNALCAWPAPGPGEGPLPPVLASGSDDTTVRLWRLSDRSLLGTLTADLDAATGSAVAPRASWVVYTPDGLFDSAIDGERQVTWLRRGELLPLEQYYDSARLFGLADRLRLGDRPPAPTFPPAPPPRVALDLPVEGVSDQPQTALTIHVGPPGAEHVRLYQNGVPVLDENELSAAAASGARRATVTLKLARGVNRFYALASRAGSIDGRSNEVEVLFNRPEEPTRRTHVLALGVGNYSPNARALQFAGADASSIAEFLHRNGLGSDVKLGAQVILTDDQVNQTAVDNGFVTIRDSDLSPDDTVVVFVAGHTGTQRERYYLLLPEYQFPAGGEVPADLREVRTRTALPFSTLQEDLARLRCLNRLVIVDACQAESVLDDPTVQRLNRAVDDTAHRARTAYIFAARRGEPASEAAQLKHGLLTYTLLKGLGQTGLEPPPDAAVLEDPPTADRDGDALVTASELAFYTDQSLPRLAASLPNLVQRAGVGLPVPGPATRQHPRVMATDLNFPLLRLK